MRNKLTLLTNFKHKQKSTTANNRTSCAYSSDLQNIIFINTRVSTNEISLTLLVKSDKFIHKVSSERNRGLRAK